MSTKTTANWLNLVRRFLFICSLCLLGGCGLFAPPVTPDPSAFLLDTVASNLLLPPGCAIDIADLKLVTSFGESAVANDGCFSIPVNRACVQLVIALTRTNEPFLLGISLGGHLAPLDARSTASALAFLSPPFATTDLTEAAETLAFLQAQPEFALLEHEIAQRLRLGIPLSSPSTELLGALRALIGAAVNRLLSVPPKESTAHPAGVSPASEQSFFAVELASESERAKLSLRLLNYGKRFVQVWWYPLDRMGKSLSHLQPVPGLEWTKGLMESVPSLSVGSILSREFLDPARRDVTLPIPQNAAAVKLEVWGPGFVDWGSISPFDYIIRADMATFMTVVCDILAPLIDSFVGVKLLTRGPGRPTNFFRCLQGVADAYSASTTLIALVEGLAATDVFKVAGTLVDLFIFVMTDPRAHQALICIGKDKFGAQILQSALNKFGERILGWVFVLFNIVDLVKTATTLGLAKPREIFTIDLPDPCRSETQQPDLTLDCPAASVSPTFSWSATDNCSQPSEIEYQHWLEGHETGWSAWSGTTSKSYSGLVPGKSYTFHVRARDKKGNVVEHLCSFTIAVTCPDLAVQDLTIEPVAFSPGERVTVKMQWINLGNGDAGPFTVSLKLDGRVIDAAGVPGLAAGRRQIGVKDDLLWPSDTDCHRIEVVLDSHNTLTECREDNNAMSRTFCPTYSPPTLPDLIIEDLDFGCPPPGFDPGFPTIWVCTPKVTVRNIGNAPVVTPFRVAFFAVTPDGQYSCASQVTIQELLAGEKYVWEVKPCQAQGIYTRIRAIADLDNIVKESNEQNNTREAQR